MKKIILTLTVFSLLFSNAFSQSLSGDYTIGGGTPDYNTFNEAVADLELNGISGAVIFNIETGTYNEQLTIPKIEGSSSVNTITFQSVTGDSTDVVLEYASTSVDSNYTLKFDTCSYVNFKKMTINSQGTINYNNLIEINNSHTLGFYNCQLIGHTNHSSYGSRLIYSNEDSINANNITIQNCYLNYGRYGIVLTGKSSSEQSSNLEISGNVFYNQIRTTIRIDNYKNSEISNNNIFSNLDYYGIYVKYSSYIDVLSNNIAASTNTHHTGILFSDNDFCNVKNNTIYNFRIYGIKTYGSNNVISNNFISGEGTGIYTGNSPFQEIYHNSINSSDVCMHITFDNVTIKNNILYNKNGGYCLKIYTTNITIDYNDIYTTGAILGHWNGTDCADLTEWQTASSQDANSISYNPDYISNTDLHTNSLHLNNVGVPIAEVITDIDGEARNASTPDIGADEFTPHTTDVSILEIITNSDCDLSTTEDITIKVVNKGTNPQASIPVYYTIDGGTTYASETITNLLSGDTAEYTFTTKADFSVPNEYTCIAFTDLIGDAYTANDTLSNTIYSYGSISSYPFNEDFEQNMSNYFKLSANEYAGSSVVSNAAYNSNYGLSFNKVTSGSGWTGGDNPDSTQLWVENYKYQAFAKSCNINISNLSNPALQFDMQINKIDYASNTVWFRVLINDTIELNNINGDSVFNFGSNLSFKNEIFMLNDYIGDDFTLTFQSCMSHTYLYVYVDNILIGERPIVDLGEDVEFCNGDSATVDAGSGAGYTYAWFNTESTDTIGVNQTLKVFNSGTYYVDVYSDAGIISYDTITVTVNPLPVVDFGFNDTSLCEIDSIILIAGNTDNTYVWKEISFADTLSQDTAFVVDTTYGNGTYYVIATNTNGCVSGDTVTVNFISMPVVDLITNDTTLCANEVITIIAGTSENTYIWSDTIDGSNVLSSDTSFTFDYSIGSGKYYVLVTNSGNCTTTDSVQITFNSLPEVEIGPNDTIICDYDSLVLIGGTLENTYIWKEISSTDTISQDTSFIVNNIIGDGTYYVIVTNSNECSFSDTIQISFQQAPIVNDIPSDTAVCEDISITLIAGTNNYSYNWTSGSSPTSISTDTALVIDYLLGADTYYFTATDIIGCMSTDSTTVGFYSMPYIDLVNDTSVCEDENLILSINNNNYEFVWSNSNDASDTLSLDSTITLNSDNGSGYYYVFVTNENNCSISDSVNVTFNPLPDINIITEDTTLCLNNSLSVTAGSNEFSYIWTDISTGDTLSQANTFVIDSVIGSGTFKVLASNSFGCKLSDTVTVAFNPIPYINLGNDITLCEGETIELTAGTNDNNYIWTKSGDTLSINNTLNVDYTLGSGNYIAEATNIYGCSNTDNIQITFNPLPIVDLGNDTTLCAGSFLFLQIYHNYDSYLWSTGATINYIYLDTTIAGLEPYTLSVTVTNNNCTVIDSVEVWFTPLPVVNLGADTTIFDNQTITLDAGEGFASYLWEDGSTEQTFFIDGATVGLGNKYCFVTVSDTNNCTGNDNIYVNVIHYDDIYEIINSNIKIYPNPNSGQFYINASGYDIEIISQLGEKIYKRKNNNQSVVFIDLPALKQGIYFIKLSNGNKSYIKKLNIR
ncbi:MAG: T9SS type A sorting domain-containing protein [Bacteroidales bacterium]|nr:T9SS type A sorting domain-containing protein [Bacteroidales bacterium]